jgi:hypothetical protein
MMLEINLIYSPRFLFAGYLLPVPGDGTKYLLLVALLHYSTFNNRIVEIGRIHCNQQKKYSLYHNSG